MNKMLINLSNHPKTTWSQRQLEAATTAYGEVLDIPFPQIDPSDSSAAVAQLADNYLQRIRDLQAKNHLSVHLMGEMTFTHALVRRLQCANIRCVASTSKRTVLHEEDGKKTIQFNFIQFREYPEL